MKNDNMTNGAKYSVSGNGVVHVRSLYLLKMKKVRDTIQSIKRVKIRGEDDGKSNQVCDEERN